VPVPLSYAACTLRPALVLFAVLVACENKPRRPPAPVAEERPLSVAVPAGTVELGLRAEPGGAGTALVLVVRRASTERRIRVDQRPEVSCSPALRSAGDLDACVADEVAWRLIPGADAIELRWARSAGGPDTLVERVPLAGARPAPLR